MTDTLSFQNEDSNLAKLQLYKSICGKKNRKFVLKFRLYQFICLYQTYVKVIFPVEIINKHNIFFWLCLYSIAGAFLATIFAIYHFLRHILQIFCFIGLLNSLPPNYRTQWSQFIYQLANEFVCSIEI